MSDLANKSDSCGSCKWMSAKVLENVIVDRVSIWVYIHTLAITHTKLEQTITIRIQLTCGR